jgi:hypothetical protein
MNGLHTNLAQVAAALAAPGKGILASDESIGTIGKRLEKAGLVNDEVNHQLGCGAAAAPAVTAPAAAAAAGDEPTV